MSSQKLSLPAVILVVIFAALALFAFTRQQQSASSEATAIAKADAASASQATSDAGQQTAVAQANTQGTAQAEAQNSEATAIAMAQVQGTSQADAQNSEATALAQAQMQATAQADAQNSEATSAAAAQMQANLAMTAQSVQAIAETTRSAAEDSAQLAAEVAQNQAATALVAMGQAQAQADIAQTAVSQSTAIAGTASAQQLAAQATGTMIRQQNGLIRQTATAQAGVLQATETGVAQAVGTLQSALTPVAQVNQFPEETMRFLIANQAIEGFAGRVADRMDYDIDMVGKDDWITWQRFSGRYTNFVVSAEIHWWDGAAEDACGFLFRSTDDDNFYSLEFNRDGHLNLSLKQDDDWKYPYRYKISGAIRTGLDDINQVVLVVQNDEILVYINGQPAAYYVDDTFADAGEVAVAASTFDESDQAGCKFNNAWVWDLDSDLPTVTPILPTAVIAAATSLPPYPVPELSETFTYSDQSYVFHYPHGWITQEYDDGSMTINSGRPLPALLNGNAPDAIGMTVWAAPKAALEGRSFLALVDDLISDSADWDDPYDGVTFGTPELFHLNEADDAVRAVGRSQNFDIEVIAFGKDDGAVIIYAMCGAGNMSRCEPTVYAIAASLSYYSNVAANESSFWNTR